MCILPGLLSPEGSGDGSLHPVFGALAERTSDSVSIADMEERIVYINPATRRMLGLGPEEDVIGTNLARFFTPESYRLIREEGVPHVLQYGTWDKELAFRHQDGTEIPVAMHGMVIRDDRGVPRYVAAISRGTGAAHSAGPLRQAAQALRPANGELHRDAANAKTSFLFLTAKGEKKDLRTGMNPGVDDYLSNPVAVDESPPAVRSRLEGQPLRSATGFSPDFSSAKPLEALGLSRREAEVLLWLAQGKSNPAIGLILGNTVSTVKKHVGKIFTKLGLETRHAAAMRALEVLSRGGR